MNQEVIFNAEPSGFSPVARAQWISLGEYHEASLDDPAQVAVLARSTVLIVRLARHVGEDLLCRMPALRTLISATTGHDHIDKNALTVRGIRLLSLRGETDFLSTIPSTAEHCLGLILALLRRIPAAVQSVAAGQWQRDRFRGRQMKGRRLGLVGLGRTGRMVAGYAQALGMEVRYFDPHVEVGEWNRADNLHELLAWAEIVSLHVHLTNQTRDMIGSKQIAAMTPGAWFINTSRGGLVDERALVSALKEDRLSGAAMDVLATELQDIEASPLLQAMRAGVNVIITPHIGGATIDAMHACEEFVATRYSETLATSASAD